MYTRLHQLNVEIPHVCLLHCIYHNGILFNRFGPGAGGASGGLLAIMPRTRSMVRRVAAVSGSPLAGKIILDSNNINRTVFILTLVGRLVIEFLIIF